MLSMKTLPSLLLSVALIAATATAASAFSLSPPDTRAMLKGTLTLYPGGGQPFKCKVTLRLRTKDGAGAIESVKLDTSAGCEGLRFAGLPWFVGLNNANSGQFGSGDMGFFGGGGNCSEGGENFQDNASGIWTLPAGGQCFSGTLTSNPPVTIVP
jgi:hypothetical protein